MWSLVDIFTLLILVLVGCALMYFFPDSRRVVQFVLAVAALIWFGTVMGWIPERVHFR